MMNRVAIKCVLGLATALSLISGLASGKTGLKTETRIVSERASLCVDDYSKRVIRKLVLRCTTDEQILNVLASVSPEATEKIVSLLNAEKEELRQGKTLFRLINAPGTVTRCLNAFFKSLLLGSVVCIVGAAITLGVFLLIPALPVLLGIGCGTACCPCEIIGTYVLTPIAVGVVTGGVAGTTEFVHELRKDDSDRIKKEATAAICKIDQVLACIGQD